MIKSTTLKWQQILNAKQAIRLVQVLREFVFVFVFSGQSVMPSEGGHCGTVWHAFIPLVCHAKKKILYLTSSWILD